MERTRHAQRHESSETRDEWSDRAALVDGNITDPSQRTSLPLDADATFDRTEAEAVWRLAARLQAEAVDRLASRSRVLSGDEEHDPLRREKDFTVDEIKGIAREAGLEADYVELALRERAARRVLPADVTDRQIDFASRFLGAPEDRITVSRLVKASKERVLAAMQQRFPSDPFNLELLEIIGDENRLEDAVMVFKIPQLEMLTSGSLNMFSYRMSIADLNRMVVSLHAIDERTTEVTIQLDMRHGKWRNFTYGMWIGAVFALFGGILGAVLGMKLSGPAWGITGSVLGGALGWGVLHWIYRVAYRSGLKKGRKEMEELLRLVDVTARTGGAFARASAEPHEPRTGQ